MSQRGRAASRASNVPQVNLDELQPTNVTKSFMMGGGKYVPASEYQKLFDAAKAAYDSFLSMSTQYQNEREASGRVNSSNRQLIAENSELKAQQKAVIEAEKQNAVEKARLKALQVSFDNQIEEKDKQLVDVKAQVDKLRANVLDLTSKNSGEGGALSQQLKQAQKDLDAKTEELEKTKAALEKAKSEAASALQQEKASNVEAIAAAQKEKDDAIEAAKAEMQKMHAAQIAQLMKQLEDANGKLEAADSLSKDNSAMKLKLDSTEAEKKASDAKVKEAEAKVEAQKAEDDKKLLELQALLEKERADAQEKLQAAEAKAEEARTSGIAQLTEAFNKVSGAVKKDQAEIEPSILIKPKADDFESNMKIRVVKVPKAMKLTLGGAMASFKDMTDEAVSAELEPGKFKAGSFNIKANNGFATKITLEAGDSITQVVDTLSQALEGSQLKAGTEKRGDKLFISIRSAEIGEENHFEIYPENQDVLQNIDRQVYPPPKKICIYANSMNIGESGELELQGFDLKKKWHEYMPGIDFSQPQELLINGEKISGQISPQMKIENKRISSEHALRKIGTLIQRVEKSVKFALKPIRGDDGKVTGLIYLELKSDKPLDIDFPANPMFLGNMVSFDEPETKGCVIVEGKKYEGYDFSIPNLGKIDLLHSDAAGWHSSETSPHITYEVPKMGGAKDME